MTRRLGLLAMTSLLLASCGLQPIYSGGANSAAAHNSAVIAAMTRADPSFRGRQEAAKQRAARIRCVSGGCGWR